MPQPLAHVRHVIAVASGKGGVGKSATAVNLAAALAVAGHQVGLLDADIYGPSQPRMLGVADQKPESDGQRITPVMAHGIRLMSMGFMVPEDQALVWRGPLLQKALVEMLHQVNWGTEQKPLDVLVIDMPPGTGDVALSLSQQVQLDGVVIVSTPQDIALIDARKALEMFKKVNINILGLVENMSSFTCPDCGATHSIFGKGGAQKMAADLGLDLLAEVPLDLAIRQNTDVGQPLVISQPDGPAAKTYRQLAQNVWQKLQQPQSNPTKVVIE